MTNLEFANHVKDMLEDVTDKEITVKEITKEEATNIYYEEYWLLSGANKILDFKSSFFIPLKKLYVYGDSLWKRCIKNCSPICISRTTH